MNKKRVACLIGIGLLTGKGIAQEKEINPFDDNFVKTEKLLDEAPETWEVMWEVFSVPFEDAAKLIRNQKDPKKIYGELVKHSESGKAVLEEFVLLVGQIDQSGGTESVEEMIFPTEYEPPEMPNRVGRFSDNPKVADFLVTPSTPTSFDTKKMGTDLKIEFARKETPNIIKVDLKFERVELLDLSSWGQGKAATKMPKFGVQGIHKTVFLTSGKPVMIGTMSPPKGRPAKKEKRRVWFAFATATPSE